MNILQVGDKLPSFILPSDQGDDVDISNFSGKKNIVIYFYPKDNTTGCTIEAKDFTNQLDEFVERNTVVIGISRDSIKKHQKFRENHNLKHILLSDADCEVCSKFGCWVEKSMYGKKYMGIERTTFLVNSHGIITKIWSKVKIPGHVQEVISSI
jgi:thioredoxin-dependent peroxiredoxin